MSSNSHQFKFSGCDAITMAVTTLLSSLLAFVLLCDLPITLALSSSSQASTSSPTKSNDISPFKNKIIACGSTKELTRAVELCVKPHHKVAELGSQLREVSTQICISCASATLVDVQRKFPKTPDVSQKRSNQRTAAMRLQTGEEDDDFFPDKSTFREIKKLQDWREAFFPTSSAPPSSYDVLVLDVNAIVGNDLEWTSLSLIQEFQNQNQQEQQDLIILVKSVGLNQFASRLVYGKRYTKDYSAIPPPHILGTVGVQEYRETIPHVVRPSDAILEVGCHFGTTTALLQQAGKYCIGVDVGSKIIKQANAKYPEVYFAVGDAWKTASLLRIQQDYYKQQQQQQQQQSQTTNGNDGGPAVSGDNGRSIGFDVVFVDVGGLSGSDGLLEAILLVTSIQNALEPRCIVIKSLCMQRLSTTLVSFWELQKRIMKQATQGDDDSE